MKVLKFGAVWCLGCIIMKPRWKEIEDENTWLKTEYYDYDDNEEFALSWKIGDVLPVCIFIDKNGKEIMRLVGEQSKSKLVELILKYKDE